MKPHGLALDIDNTLSASNIHWAKELERLYGNPTGMTPEELCEKYMLSSHVPHWKESPEAQEWMEQARRSPEIHHEYPLIENAKHMVNKIDAIIPITAYVTARWEVVREATEAWLWKHEFPAAPVYMRPMNAPGTAHFWKGTFLPTLYPEVQGIVDDDPRLLEHMPEDYKGTIFLYKTQEHIETPIEVVKCAKWEDVLTAVEKRYKRD